VDQVIFNGIDGTTGEFLTRPLSVPEMFEVLRQRGRSVDLGRVRPLHRSVDPRDLAQTGWAVVFAGDGDPVVREALEPLLAWRREQAGELYRELRGESGYQPGQRARTFLRKHGADTAVVVAGSKLPYYVLLVGDPEEIPFEFQYGLDVSHAVGRLSLDDAEGYARYAEAVVATEKGEVQRRRRADFVAPRHPGDRPTELSSELLVSPPARELAARHGPNGKGWEERAHLADDAGHGRFSDVLGGPSAPAFAFTASHGLGYPSGHPGQRAYQGALLCQEWPGPEARGVRREHFFAAEDVTDAADVAGLVSFHFACYGAGCPEHDDFAMRSDGPARRRAPAALISELPRRLLAHPRGGAQAFVGHVDRAWAYSFLSGSEPQITVFRETFDDLLRGYPVGAAMEYFNQRYAQLATYVTSVMHEDRYDGEVDPSEVVALWTANNDARSYVLLGDPAVRLAVNDA
jgi:hypothetical protein